MKKVLIVLLAIFIVGPVYSQNKLRVGPYQNKTKPRIDGSLLYVELGEIHNQGKHYHYYDNIYAYNHSDYPVMFELTVKRCLKHMFSDKKLSNKCSEETTVFRYIPPHTSRFVVFDGMKEWDDPSNALPYLDIPGNWPWGFQIWEFIVQ